jgi:hypothetical protein
MENLVILADKLSKSLDLKIYFAWNIKKNKWENYKIYKDREEFGYIPEDINLVEIDFSNKIPQDIIRIFKFNNELFSEKEKLSLAQTKLRQIINTFIFHNKELKDRLENMSQ